MSTSPEGFARRIDRLKQDIAAQAARARSLIDDAVMAAFDRDGEAADRVIKLDDEIDRVDVQIEVDAVRIIADATCDEASLSDRQVRTLLTIVKVNNDLERIADLGVEMAKRVGALRDGGDIPPTMRVMAYSVIGIMRDACTALDRGDPDLAHITLRAEDAVENFRAALLHEAEQKVNSGEISANFAFFLNGITAQLFMIADHCTNIAEQVIYLTTGSIVRHAEEGWVEHPMTRQRGPETPPA